MISDEYLGGEATALPFFLDREEKGLECFDGEAIATSEGGWSDCLVGDIVTPDVAIDDEAIFFNSKESDDFGRGEVGWLGIVSDEVVLNMPTVGFMASTFCCMALGTTGGLGVVASVATREATRDSTRDRGGGVSVFCRLEAEAVALASAVDFFLDGTPPRVCTIMRLSKKKEQSDNGGFGLRGKEEKKKQKLELEHSRSE